MTLHREAASKATRKRGGTAIDEAIADFGSAIGDVLKAITDASTSLTATCSTMREVADDTLNRMAVASKAASETTQRVHDHQAQATEELSGSIQHIGQEATRGPGHGQGGGRRYAARAAGDPLAEQHRRTHRLDRQHHFDNRVANQSCWRSTRPSKRRAPATPARDSRWSPPK